MFLSHISNDDNDHNDNDDGDILWGCNNIYMP